MKRVYFKPSYQAVSVIDALTNAEIAKVKTVSEAVIYAIKNDYQIPAQAFNGEFIKTENGDFVYETEKGFELADGTLLLDVKRCHNCGYIAVSKEIIDEEQEPRECYVCIKCGWIEECTPEIPEIGEGD